MIFFLPGDHVILENPKVVSLKSKKTSKTKSALYSLKKVEQRDVLYTLLLESIQGICKGPTCRFEDTTVWER